MSWDSPDKAVLDECIQAVRDGCVRFRKELMGGCGWQIDYGHTIEGVRWIKTNKPEGAKVSEMAPYGGLGSQASGASPTSVVDMIPGADGPYCPPNEPKTKNEADSRVEWVLANLCDGELSRLYKLMHDGRGYRVESCDTISNRWKKGLS